MDHTGVTPNPRWCFVNQLHRPPSRQWKAAISRGSQGDFGWDYRFDRRQGEFEWFPLDQDDLRIVCFRDLPERRFGANQYVQDVHVADVVNRKSRPKVWIGSTRRRPNVTPTNKLARLSLQTTTVTRPVYCRRRGHLPLVDALQRLGARRDSTL